MSTAFPDVYGMEELPPTSSLNDTACIQTFKKHPEKTIQQAKKRNTDCANKILWSGYYPWEYPEKDLFKIKTGRKTICYTKNQLLLMNQLGIFPSQIKKPKLPIVKKLQYNSSPISNLVSPDKCIDNLNIPVDNIHMYVVSSKPITDWESLMPIYFKKANTISEILWYKYEPSWARDGFNNYIYQLTYKKAFRSPPKELNYNDVASVKLLSNIDDYGDIDLFRLSGSKGLTDELKNWLLGRSNNFPSLHILKDLSLKLSKVVFAFRGLIFELNSIPDTWKNYQVGDKLTISSRGNPMSWTTNFCLAKHFSLIDMMGKKAPKSILVGFVLSTHLQPSQILIDTRLLSATFLKSIYNKLQTEIITVATKDNGDQETFDCTIEEVTLIDKQFESNGWNSTRYLPVKSVSALRI